jgi:hypothetical protein
MSKEIELGKITKVSLEIEDHGILTFWLHFDFGGSGQGFGGYAIENELGAKALRKIMEAVDVDAWEKIPGHEMYVHRENGIIRAIEAPKYNGGRYFNIKTFYDDPASNGQKETNEVSK